MPPWLIILIGILLFFVAVLSINVGIIVDYKEELCQHDIQLSPISLGTGTKGKVLDAFVNGLLVIAPLRAIENIQVKDKEDYFFYSSPNELPDILKRIALSTSEAQDIAKSGRESILLNHGVLKITINFFQLFNEN